jgi:TRAP-type transport system large permease protein
MSLALFSCLMVLIVLATIGASIPLSMIISAIVYLAVKGQDMGLAAEQIIQGLYDSFVILAIPLFIVAANFMNAGTISDRLNTFCLAIVGRLKGGMGHVNVLNSLVFAGMSGSAVADVVGMGKMSIDMMIKNNRYPLGYAAAITAATAVVGPIIPPSIPMVLYSIVSDASIGYLFLGGVVPGLIMCAAMMMLNTYMAHRMNVPLEEPVPLREIPSVTFKAFPALLMPIILLAGIYGGATTPTEAAAIAAAYAFIVAVFFYRALNFSNIRTVMHDSVKSSASVGLIIGSALIFNYIVATENIPAQVQNLMKGVEISPVAFLLLLNLLFLVLGCLLDASTIILVIIPVFIPTVKALGIDLVHFGVVAIVNCMIGLITPPYGVLLFVLNAITGIPMKVLIQYIWPWVGVLIAALLLMILVPDTVLWLPKMFGYVPAMR